jgi:hypothetical protein
VIGYQHEILTVLRRDPGRWFTAAEVTLAVESWLGEAVSGRAVSNGLQALARKSHIRRGQATLGTWVYQHEPVQYVAG